MFEWTFADETTGVYDDTHELLLSCIHEAGHAAIAVGLDLKIEEISIAPRSSVTFPHSLTRQVWRDQVRRQFSPKLCHMAIVCAAGPAAEAVYCRNCDIPVQTVLSGYGDLQSISTLMPRSLEPLRHPRRR